MPKKVVRLSTEDALKRADRLMEGLSWDDAERIGIEILARCFALHVYSRKEGSGYYKDVMLRICERADEWAHEGDHPFVLAMAAVGNRLKEKMEGN